MCKLIETCYETGVISHPGWKRLVEIRQQSPLNSRKTQEANGLIAVLMGGTCGYPTQAGDQLASPAEDTDLTALMIQFWSMKDDDGVCECLTGWIKSRWM